MHLQFARTLSHLRHEKGVSQRQAARELEVSQALLSHYENGIREPGLPFVVRACDYYGVSADYLLGRSVLRTGSAGDEARAAEAAKALLRTADTLSRTCLDLCGQEPALTPFFRQLAGQLAENLK